MALWTPAAITTALWLDASDASTVTLVSGAVSQWSDKSGLGHDFSQATSNKRPVTSTLNSLTVIDFDGSNDVLTRGANSIGRNTSSLSFYWVLRPETVNADRRFWNSSHGTGVVNARALQGFNSSSAWRVGGRREDAGSYAEDVSVSASGDVNSWVITGFQYNYSAATLTLFRNALQVSAGSWLNAGTSSDTDSQTAYIGSAVGGTAQFYDGQIAEGIAIHADVSTATRQKVEGYLAWKWGLEANLPAGHPYKSAAPTISPYAVNGKEPIAAWIPSLDTAGNGTTTLTDLVGSNNGTLTNMDAATDWVSDTSNGGVRALDFDGVDDYVDVGNITGAGAFSVSVWFRPDANSDSIITKGESRAINTARDWDIFGNGSSILFIGNDSTGTNIWSLNGGAYPSLYNWHHVVAAWDGTTNANGVSLYLNGVLIGNAQSLQSSVSTLRNIYLGGFRTDAINYEFDGRLDDIRIFDQALDASDIAYLYNNGNGRGRTPSIYAVNGKDPIAAWIPSRDTAGNGTTTLTDLVGSNDGTLTNMDAATDWVADTDAGGVRALDFDGVNDYVIKSSAQLGYAGPQCVSLWFKLHAINAANSPTIFWYALTTSPFYSQIGVGFNVVGVGPTVGTTKLCVIDYDATGALAVSGAYTNTSFSSRLNEWIHVCGGWDGSRWFVYINGIDETNAQGIQNSPTLVTSETLLLGGLTASRRFDGLVDDVRYFHQALDATDIAYLYDSGNGRGIIVESPSIPSAIYHPFASLKHPLTF